MAEKLGRFGHWHWMVGSEEIFWSTEALRLLGLDSRDGDRIYQRTALVLADEEQIKLNEGIRRAVIEQAGFAVDLQYNGPDGSAQVFHVVGESEKGPDGRTVGIFGVMQDITEHRRISEELRIANERRIDYTEMTSDWMWEMDANHRYTYVSHQFERALGLKSEELIGKNRGELRDEGEELSLELEMHLAWLEQHKPFRDFRFWLVDQEGKRRCISTTGKPLFGREGEFLGYRGYARDVTTDEVKNAEFMRANRDLKAANREKSEALISLKQANALLEEQADAMMRVQAEIQHTALHDPLTGIANRRFLDERMSELASLCQRRGDWLAVLHIDLDRFKQINDTAGHAAGDALLVHVAKILRENVRENDFVARIGGDEFVVVCGGDNDIKVPGEIAQRIITQAGQPFRYEGREFWFGASIGIATSRGTAVDPHDLLVNADIALYRAKNYGRGRFEYFSTELQAEIIHNKQIADGIRAGLKRDEFLPFYQPQIDARTHQVAGFEALARWDHPTEGMLPPNEFLGIAEELNVVARIDQMIMEATLDDYRRWSAAGHFVPRLSVNVSSRRLRDPDLIASLKQMDLPRGIMAFELLESVFLDDADETIVWHIDMLKEMGIDVELDDFGSGHASIISLIKLGPDAIKIDRELIRTITSDRARRDLVRSIIEIGRSLSVRVVAEGVETLDQAYLLCGLGCDVLQGFYFSEPLGADQVPEFIDTWNGGRGKDLHKSCEQFGI